MAGLESADTLQDADIGPVYAHVKFKVSGNICDPNYRLKDGDAAFLDPGTPIYQVSGYPPSERLAGPLQRPDRPLSCDDFRRLEFLSTAL